MKQLATMTKDDRVAKFKFMHANVKMKRMAKGLSQSQLAELSGVNVRTLQDYEQGNRDINKATGETLFKLAHALECKIEDLLEFNHIIEE